MSTVQVGSVRFRISPQDHEPVHVHGRSAETVVVVERPADGTVQKATRKDAVLPPDAKRSDVRKILKIAAEHDDELMAAWEHMQE